MIYGNRTSKKCVVFVKVILLYKAREQKGSVLRFSGAFSFMAISNEPLELGVQRLVYWDPLTITGCTYF